MEKLILKVDHLAKSFGRHQVLADISLSVRAGEIVAITGENGSGKSTLLKILTGLLKASRGNAQVYGTVGYCPQEMLVFETLTVDENFRYFGQAYQRTCQEFKWRDSVDLLAQGFHFGQYRKVLVSELSGGTRQKLNLAIALMHSPDLLILDEPYTGFDWETYIHFWDYANEFRRRGRSIMMVSHFIYDRSKIDTLWELKDGILRCAPVS